MMQFIIMLLMMLSQVPIALANPSEMQNLKGIVKASSMVEGEFFWIKGKVGEGRYYFTNPDGQQCSITVALVVGSKAEASIGIHSGTNIVIDVLNEQLSQDIQQGQPITSEAWQIGTTQNIEHADAIIKTGLNPEDGFIINSRPRWRSWWFDNVPQKVCQTYSNP
ncbi:hypothetical protein F9817_20520 [Vibrio sp. CAIM 722]|uniref:Uncharacterized protein n=1 Tax=Vibrio eleionomae TaxID=2653505 RepID=A0A7X4LP51_9VIBR|nr:hypothetical protein [Vibrio eleionomae]MZI95568.1 hypothetical protein [Vibrio eleionomae]